MAVLSQKQFDNLVKSSGGGGGSRLHYEAKEEVGDKHIVRFKSQMWRIDIGDTDLLDREWTGTKNGYQAPKVQAIVDIDDENGDMREVIYDFGFIFTDKDSGEERANPFLSSWLEDIAQHLDDVTDIEGTTWSTLKEGENGWEYKREYLGRGDSDDDKSKKKKKSKKKDTDEAVVKDAVKELLEKEEIDTDTSPDDIAQFVWIMESSRLSDKDKVQEIVKDLDLEDL